MPRIYKLSRAGLKLLYKIRHHRGHGIHSPFVFNLIKKVIEEKGSYAAYEDVKLYLKANPNLKYEINKYNTLSFRLVNYFNAKRILELGSGKGLNSLYLTAAASDIVCICYETDPARYEQAKILYQNWHGNINLHTETLPLINEKQDCIFVNLRNCENLPRNLPVFLENMSHDKTFIIVKGIRTNGGCKALWKSIANIEGRTAMLDLFNIGIIFFDKQLYRWNYQISF